MNTLHSRIIFPVLIIVSVAFFALFSVVDRIMNDLVFSARVNDLRGDVVIKKNQILNSALVTSETPDLSLVARDILGTDNGIFRLVITDETAKVLFAYPNLDHQLGENDKLNIEQLVKNPSENRWVPGDETRDIADEKIYGAFLRGYIPLLYDGQKLAIVVDASLAANDASRKNLQVVVLTFFLLTVTVLTLTILGISDVFLIRPIRALNESARRLARGDLGTVIKVHGVGVVRELALAFRDMSSKLKDLYLGFDYKVAEKTKALDEKAEESRRARVAMENILEDTRLLAEKEARQAQELGEAMGQVEKFAHDADRERRMYSLMLANIGEGIIAVNTERRIIVVNLAAQRLLGYTGEELTSDDFTKYLQFLHDDRRPLGRDFWDEVFGLSYQIPRFDRVVLLGKNAKETPVYFNVSRIVNPQTGHVNGIIVTIRDESDERVLEDARVGFISTASHQLRTPLTSMRWFSEMLLRGDAGAISEEQKGFVERISESTERMIALVNLLLQLARVEAGRVMIAPIPLDLRSVVEGVTEMFHAGLEARSLRVEITSDPTTLPLVPMDRDVIWQIVQNLLSNAIRYSKHGGIITVHIQSGEHELRCSVKDFGIGIPESARERIFEKFYRADNAVKVIPEGSGLGLALVKTLVEKWGGKIWFTSEESTGTTFFFTIPLSGMPARDGDVTLAV